ncbi:alpha/beta hydrolase fold-domain-containing protein [Lactarius akahatsu]|uniref:Alpha/beta hydrolase fold-domain-containing protein n=1 Tax=Lactarius akahatsu TaxID=416441 RepID=A0AAD4LDN2_9AGAM|nr:alpha/beta hydrolase fold-domain-containing protein [Lactarius akahatsu]
MILFFLLFETGVTCPFPGMIFGNIDQDDYFMRNLSTELQVTTLNVEYRVAPDHLFPTQLNDSHAALKWAVANVDALSVSLKKGFLLGGCSAGGTLSAGLSIRVRDDPLFSDTPVTGQYPRCPAFGARRCVFSVPKRVAFVGAKQRRSRSEQRTNALDFQP